MLKASVAVDQPNIGNNGLVEVEVTAHAESVSRKTGKSFLYSEWLLEEGYVFVNLEELKEV